MNPIHALAKAKLSELAPVVSRTSALDGTALDIQAYEGSVLVILAASAAIAGTDPTLAVKVQHADTEGGTYADVPGGAFAGITDTAGHEVLVLNADNLKRWVKVVGTIGGTSSPEFAFGVSIAGLHKYD
jgi:hypothetical protein